MPDKVCAYCGEKVSQELKLYIEECPVCTTLACTLCMAQVKFFKVLSKGDETILVRTYEGNVCRVHLPWNIIASLERKAEEDAR